MRVDNSNVIFYGFLDILYSLELKAKVAAIAALEFHEVSS